MKKRPAGEHLHGGMTGWEALPRQIKLQQIRDLILDPCWASLSLEAKQRWLEQFQRCRGVDSLTATGRRPPADHGCALKDNAPDE